MRAIIAAMQMTLDGFIEGPNGELDWVQAWDDPFDLLSRIDACVLGGRMYPGYEAYWSAILADPHAVLEFTGRPPTAGEISYAQFARATPHVVVSMTLESAAWDNTTIVRNLDAVRRLKQGPGADIHAVGGAALVASLINAGLVDELRVVVRPVVLGGGKAMFAGVTQPHRLTLVEARPLGDGATRLTYRL